SADRTDLSPRRRGLLDRLHRNDGVDTRHVALPLPEYDGLRGITARNDRYLEAALDVGEQALRGALDAAGLTGSNVDLLIVTSVTGVAGAAPGAPRPPPPPAAAGRAGPAPGRPGLGGGGGRA